MPTMPNNRIPPTLGQRRLVNIGMFIQFHLAALGHLAAWVCAFDALINGGGFLAGILAWFVVPISFGILVAVYVLFRFLLACADFGTALTAMLLINVCHAYLATLLLFSRIVIAEFFCIVPVRLAIPIVLYATACYLYRQHRVKLLQENESRERNEVERPDVPA